MLPAVGYWVDADAFSRFVKVALLCITGLFSYVLVLLLTGIRPKLFATGENV